MFLLKKPGVKTKGLSMLTNKEKDWTFRCGCRRGPERHNSSQRLQPALRSGATMASCKRRPSGTSAASCRRVPSEDSGNTRTRPASLLRSRRRIWRNWSSPFTRVTVVARAHRRRRRDQGRTSVASRSTATRCFGMVEALARTTVKEGLYSKRPW